MFCEYIDFTILFLSIQVLHKKITQPTKPSITLAAQQDHKRITQNIAIYLTEYNKKNTLKLVKEQNTVEYSWTRSTRTIRN
jgi:hypothetical protein